MIKFIVVVPHGLCNPTLPYRHCDRRAKKASEIIKNMLTKKNLPYEYIFADKYRSEIDLNREPARGYRFRERVREEIIKASNAGYYVVVLEIHSFPEGYVEYSNFKDMDIGLISIPRYSMDMYELAKYVNSKTGFNLDAQPGINTNDIQWDTSTLPVKNISHYLIEFKEDKECSEDVYDALIEGSMRLIKGGYVKNSYIVFLIIIILIYIVWWTILRWSPII